MNEIKLAKMKFIFLGFVLGLVLAYLDRWIDNHHKSYLFSWASVVMLFMLSGGVIGSLLRRIFIALAKKDEAIVGQKKAMHELSRLQTEMARLERLNLVGQLAAGLAHEIRNPLTTVRGYLQFLGGKPEFRTYGARFELMIEELDRANLIITEFLSFVKDRHTEMKSQNINDILQHLYSLLEADSFSQNKQLFYEATETPKILMNSQEISQLVLNLCRNGLEAMQEGGTLRIRTFLEGEQVVLSVQDEGGGIPEEYVERLGTPFFTTKENGTGLGIATCYRIADRHNAKIDLDTGPGGTTFYVRFPCPVTDRLAAPSVADGWKRQERLPGFHSESRS